VESLPEEDPFAPRLVEEPQPVEVQKVSSVVVIAPPTADEAPIKFQLLDVSSDPLPAPPTEDQLTESPTLSLYSTPPPPPVKEVKEASTTLTSGGYLARPSNIYAEEPTQFESKSEDPGEEPHQLVVKKEEDPTFDMQLVIKETPAADEAGTVSTHVAMSPVEEPALQDEAEDQKRKAAERLHKLRNLSFNVNAADPNNEYENVPAYIRRNLSLHNTAHAQVEKFYSHYTVKTDENNQVQISTINTFLE
jgi:cell division protein FtsZ